MSITTTPEAVEAALNALSIANAHRIIAFTDDRSTLCTCSATLPPGDFDQHRAEAVATAVVSILGLTSETCCEGTYREQEETGKFNVYTCADSGRSCRTRLVGPWRAS